MVEWRRIPIVVVAALAVVQIVHADLMPFPEQETDCETAVRLCGQADCQETSVAALFDCNFGLTAFGLRSPEGLPALEVDPATVCETRRCQGLVDRSNSFDLCLCGLIALGVCRSGHWVRRSSVGFVPDWYHNGGPFQIGHSHALMPGSLSPVPVCCFVQPARAVEARTPRYDLRTVVSHWRKSQFTPDVIASRGPPLLRR